MAVGASTAYLALAPSPDGHEDDTQEDRRHPGVLDPGEPFPQEDCGEPDGHRAEQPAQGADDRDGAGHDADAVRQKPEGVEAASRAPPPPPAPRRSREWRTPRHGREDQEPKAREP